MRRPRVLVAPHFRQMAEIFSPDAVRVLQAEFEIVWGRDEAMPSADFAREVLDADAVVFAEWPENVDLVGARPGLRALLDVSGTLDHPTLDYSVCFERDIQVGTIAPIFARPVAEHCLGLAIAAGRGISDSNRRFRDGSEQYQHAGTVGCSSLFGRTVGFVGCGGLSVALQALLEPFGCTLVGYDPWLADDELHVRRIDRCMDLESLFSRSGVVFVLAVPTPSNRGLISRDLMETLESDDVLVVGSRAHLVDFDALTELLLAGRFRAGVDVFPTEPLCAHHPIRSATSAVLTAHIAGALPDDLLSIGDSVLADLRSIFLGNGRTQLQYATSNFVRGLGIEGPELA